MPLFLHKSRLDPWYGAEERPTWLSEEDIPAGPVCSFTVNKNNVMSVFICDEKTHAIEQIAAVFTIMRRSLQEFEYVSFISEDVVNAGIKICQVKGNTPDQQINQMHRNLKEISAQRLIELTRRIIDKGVGEACDTVYPKEIATEIARGVSVGRFGLDAIHNDIVEKAKNEWGVQIG